MNIQPGGGQRLKKRASLPRWWPAASGPYILPSGFGGGEISFVTTHQSREDRR